MGGGIYNSANEASSYPGSLTTVNVTIVENNEGGGLYVNSGTAGLYNTIVALNANGGTADDIATSTGISVAPGSSNDLTGTGGSGGLSTAAASGNVLGVSTAGLALGPLANNGGPTQTIALLAGSLAIDAGSNTMAKTLRNHHRPARRPPRRAVQ